jgi:S1-C subfamily serine protease
VIDDDIRSERGVPIGISLPGSPAASAGLQTGDHIAAVNDVLVHERDDLILAISSSLAGSTVRLKVLKNWGETKFVSVTLVKAYQAGQSIAPVKHPFARGIRVDYTSVLVRGGWGQEIQPGVLVREVEKGSQAESARLQDAIIIMVDGHEVHTPAEFYAKMRKVGSVELTLAGTDEHNQTHRVTLD